MKLAVEVLRAHDLKPKDGHGTANPFVEVEFDGQRQRTETKLNDLNPSWNETLVFHVSDPLDLPERSIDVFVFHERSSFSAGHPCSSFLGRVRLSGSSVAPSRLDAARQLCPLDKRSLFSNVRGEIALRLYALSDAYQAADLHLPLSSNSAPSTVHQSILSSAVLESVRTTISAEDTSRGTETLPPKKKKSQRSSTKERERREFRSIGTASVTGRSSVSYATHFFSNHERKQNLPPQDYYREKHEQAGPAVAASVQPAPSPKTEYGLVETQPPLAALLGYLCLSNRDKIKNTYDLVEQMEYLYVHIVRARDLPAMDMAGSVDPYAEVKVGNFTGKTKHREQNRNPEWDEVFAFSKAHIHAQRVEVAVKDKNLIKDDPVGNVVVELAEVPIRAPPDGPVAPQWYRLRKGNGGGDDAYRGEIMMAVWMGTQADEAYPDALHSDAHLLPAAGVPHTRAKVYFSPRMSYLRVNVISAQDLQPSRPNPEIYVKAQLGPQALFTRVSPSRSPDPSWKNEELMFVVSEPFDEPVVLTVHDRVSPSKEETLAKVVIKGGIRAHADHRKPLPPQWFKLDKPNGGNGSGHGKLQLRVYYDNNYHVLDESAHFSSDFQPSAKPLWKPNIGSLELGILNARNLTPLKSTDGGGKGADAYCVAKYGPKWVRTRTILGTAEPWWNEQYSWDVHDPCTVLTIAVFNNGHVDGKNEGGKDDALGKIRIRLSTLEIGRVYTHYYPLLVLHPSGLKKTGELHLALRFTCTSWYNMLFLYTQPMYPKMHYAQPIPHHQMNMLREHATQRVAAKLGRAEPPLRKEVVRYVLDVGSHIFSLRKGKSHWLRIQKLFSEVGTFVQWFDDVRSWTKPAMTAAAHALFIVLTLVPNLLLPTMFLHLFAVGAWRYRHRPRRPPHVDTKLSFAESALPDEVDEEFDSYPSTRPNEIVMSRYDRLRWVAGRLQAVAGDLANHAERLEALLSWRDPRATAIFIVFATVMAGVLYSVPFRLVVLLIGLYAMRHPNLRGKTPSVPFNFFRRLPGKADTLL